MSVSFIYGGLDRENYSWLREDGSVDQDGTATDSRVASPRRTSSERHVNQPYIYGGLDRTPVKWTQAN
jgi:hypothetical protein